MRSQNTMRSELRHIHRHNRNTPAYSVAADTFCGRVVQDNEHYEEHVAHTLTSRNSARKPGACSRRCGWIARQPPDDSHVGEGGAGAIGTVHDVIPTRTHDVRTRGSTRLHTRRAKWSKKREKLSRSTTALTITIEAITCGKQTMAGRSWRCYAIDAVVPRTYAALGCTWEQRVESLNKEK